MDFQTGLGNAGPSAGAVAVVSFEDIVYGANVLQKQQDTGNLVKYANALSPLDMPSTVKISTTRIPDMYTAIAKGQIPPALQSANRSGVSVFVETTAYGLSPGLAVNGVTPVSPVIVRTEWRVPSLSSFNDNDAKYLLLLNLAAINDGPNGLRVTEAMRGLLSRTN